jgi:NADH:ubiquinone oxidoreductase subunit 4 (subunit M)
MSKYITESEALNKNNIISVNRDVNRREFWVLLPLVILTVLMGVFPNEILNILHGSVINVVTYL